MAKLLDVNDFVCQHCLQYFDGECRAFCVPHTTEEMEHRTADQRQPLCEVIHEAAKRREAASKSYYGQRLIMPGDGIPGVKVEVKDASGLIRPLHHIIHHSPTGFEWGYYGSGPADLARSILADYFGRTFLWFVDLFYHQFKDAFVAGFGDEWNLNGGDIDEWFRKT